MLICVINIIPMNILHITDFHYSNEPKNQPAQIRFVDAFIKSVIESKAKIDFIFFTGDLVYSGEHFTDFMEVQELFIEPLCEALKIDRANVMICPGNHDVHRGQELEGIHKIIGDLTSNEEVDNYVSKQDKRLLKASLENLNNYDTFQTLFYKEHVQTFNDVLVDGMYTSHIRNINGQKIGVTTINSAWRANDSKNDSGNLLFPLYYLNDAYERIKSCDFKILLMHHPLSDFKYWNSQKLEDAIYKDYHLLFSGHTHHRKNSLHITPNIGIYHCTSSASLDLTVGSTIGYTIIETDVESFELNIQNFLYEGGEEIFYEGKKVPAQIPIDADKQNQNKFRKTVRKRFDERLDEANKLFLSYKDKNGGNNFLKLFTDPIIKAESQSSPQKEVNAKVIPIDELKNCSNVNYIVFGRDKSGKSALLFKILLDNLNEYSHRHCLPLYIDCRNYLKASKSLDIVEELRQFYELNRHDAELLSSKYHIRILLDNFKKSDALVSRPIELYLTNNPNVSVVATVQETLLNSFGANDTLAIEFINLFIHDITRKEIRLLTEKWPNLSLSNKETLLEKIHIVFKQLNIPSNYWTVSLFIWIFEKNSNINVASNFQLVELYVDNLLDKDNFILGEKYKIDFEDLKNYLADLSHELITQHSVNHYQMTYTELVTFTDKYKKSNKKFVIEVEEIIALVLEKGILKKGGENYTFRLNGVFEFFLGHYMSIDETFRNKVVQDDSFYLSFGNELEICAGLNMYDYTYVNAIYEKTKKIFGPVSGLYNKYNTDFYLLQKVEDKLKLDSSLTESLRNTLINPLTAESQDVIFEEVTSVNSKTSDVYVKKFYEKIEANSDNLEKALFILARVFRNSKLRNKEGFNNEVFDFILESTAALGFTLMDELEENKDSFLNTLSEEELMRLVTKFIPIVMQSFFYDALVQGNMEYILIEKINELKSKVKGNELKLMILYFSLIDLDFKNNEHYISEVVELLKIPILKHTILLKLYIYLALKVNGNKALEQKLKQLIKTQEFNLNNKKDKGLIEQGISKIQKSKFFNKK